MLLSRSLAAMRVLAFMPLLLSGLPTEFQQPTTSSSRPVVIASLQYWPGFGDFPPRSQILQLRSNGLLTVASDWRYGKGEQRQYQLSKSELDQVVERLAKALDRVNERKEIMDAGVDLDSHVLLIRVTDHPPFIMASRLDLKLPGAPHTDHDGRDLHDRLLWHELKDILQQAVITAAQSRKDSLPSTGPVPQP